MRTRVVLVVALLAVAVLPGTAGSAAVMCLGAEATIVGAGVINGTAGDDVIVGSGGNDTIKGLGGHDRICGLGGNDRIIGGPGRDQVQGGPGNDTIVGGLGRDILKGGTGDDNIKGNASNDRLFGEAGNDTLDGGLGTDTMTGGPGTDTCYGETKATCELPAPPPPVQLITFGNGTWVVGTDVPTGRYRMVSDGTSCYWERLSGFSGESSDRITNDFVLSESLIVDIEATDKGFTSSNCNTWSNDLTPRRTNPSANWVSDGHLLVGSEIALGTWRNSGMGEHCYWERLSGFNGEPGDRITNDFTTGPSLVTIAATDVGFYADAECGTWSKIG